MKLNFNLINLNLLENDVNRIAMIVNIFFRLLTIFYVAEGSINGLDELNLRGGVHL